MRVGDMPPMTPEEIAATFEPVPDDEIEKPKPRIGPELLAKLVEQEGTDAPAIEVSELAEGHRYVVLYRGERPLQGFMVANVNDQWNKWRDGKVPGPLVFDSRFWRLVQVPADADFAPLVAVAKARDAAPHLGDFGAIIEPRDAGYACQRIAELRGWLVHACEGLVELPEHLVRDDPARLVVGLAQQHLDALRAERADGFALGDTPQHESEPSSTPRLALIGLSGAGLWALALATAALGRVLGWW